jgi:uncharacterized repeat protein (TIGR04042 family)
VPEMTFGVRWPDGRRTTHYSPSLVVHDHLVLGERYEVAELVRRTGEALGVASERVRARYGVPCALAARSQEVIATTAAKYPGGVVEVVAMQPAPPGEPS